MDQLTLTLHKTKDTKNKVVYGTKDGSRHPERLHRQGRAGRRSTGHAPGGHIPAVSQGSLLGWGTALGRRTSDD